MGRLNDPEIHAKYTYVLSLWEYTGYITWTENAGRFVYVELGLQPKLMGKLMFEHVRSGGEIRQCEERRKEWMDWPYHYDIYPVVGNRTVYLETRFLHDTDPDDCTINVVSAHDP